ncbi:hypothetical protein K488DRAFT_75486 [Vararia minispora EC-137]|uniref:Uncharacterized protein n=1 Tax=Vararia minispora EC-137 TaxID=1314806 RepID=A0ACB8QZR2_9AGAM|nr:hypothetical protein K488DRAFT_75486 [Vararia minispora EC-137]
MICMFEGTCKKNQNAQCTFTVVILASYHFRGALAGWVGGEDVWCLIRNQMQSLKSLGYTYLFAFDTDHVVRLYQMFPSLVVAIIMEPDKQDECFNNEFDCVKSFHNPYGIPIWKILAFHFWTDARGPLGANWTLSPEPYHMEGHKPNTFLGYSIEPSCDSRAFVPHLERYDRAYIMTKRLQYLFESDNAWPPDFYEAAAKELEIDFVLGAANEKVFGKDGREIRPRNILPKGVKNLGKLELPEFLDELSKSQVLVGVGLPFTSPTPYEALCLGVPFINPIKSWDRHDPENRYKWEVQHGILKFWNPPYVYNVFKGDKQGFIDAIRSALENPIDSFVIDHMRMHALETRVQEILTKNYRGMASDILSRRQAGREDGPVRMAEFCPAGY